MTRDGVDDKDGCLHPEKVNDLDGRTKYLLYHRVNSSYICVDYGETPEFRERNKFRNIPIIMPRPGMWDSSRVGIVAPPIRTKMGWLLLYHGVTSISVYRIGAVLLDLVDPTRVLSRTTDYIFEQVRDFELKGQVSNVVFPCNLIESEGILYIYYGAADSVIGVASMPLEDLLKVLIT